MTKAGTLLDAPHATAAATARMNALVYHGPGRRAREEVPRPVIQDATDAIVRITTSTIRRTDPQLMKAAPPVAVPARIAGPPGADPRWSLQAPGTRE